MVVRCNKCQQDGKSFLVPMDEIGAAIMEAHLKTEHDIVWPLINRERSNHD